MDVVGEVEELLLAVGLSSGVARKEPLRSFTAARLPEPLHAQPEHTTAVRTAHKSQEAGREFRRDTKENVT